MPMYMEADDAVDILCYRRQLTSCPTLESEDQLRLLNFQHNAIRHIENVDGLRRLIFLDFYDNQLEEIDGLSALRSLRVLMLGKNRSLLYRTYCALSLRGVLFGVEKNCTDI